ncbi:MerR family transcriptional regulator [Streptomyces sp. B1866]|uniref:MerR family transcriptional regulator n=1 Tax=Streptomyces sp. B1866 TaxID=3075431 RepID=UPI00288E6079|nr:MerR family transcriptional regulator [Streptomyces sp. B1866]MDT3396624.1 MerR family transcriptional regulator [Streptomyces sp. B1866]
MTRGTWSIGELAARAGLPVKTVRYYSDAGLLPVAERTPGGHRRYGPEALDRLRTVRRLRALGTPVAAVTQVVTGERTLADLVAGELAQVQERLAELRWREAALRALDDCADDERLRRLEVLARVQRLPEARQDLAAACARAIPRAVPSRLAELVTAAAVPDPPPDPTAETALAYAELHVISADPRFPVYWSCLHVPDRRGKASLYAGLLDASVQALQAAPAEAAEGRPSGAAVDRLAATVARVRGEEDTPAFRAVLGAAMQFDLPLFRRYWTAVSTVTGDRGRNVGAVHVRLVDAFAPAAAPGGG